jgi:hypothetical protein
MFIGKRRLQRLFSKASETDPAQIPEASQNSFRNRPLLWLTENNELLNAHLLAEDQNAFQEREPEDNLPCRPTGNDERNIYRRKRHADIGG